MAEVQMDMFNPDQFTVHPYEMNFEQFSKRADFFHGTARKDWQPHEQMHVGTERAALDRLREGIMGSTERIYPLKHVGVYETDPHRQKTPPSYIPQHAQVIEDQGAAWESYGKRATVLYRNQAEDLGSVSAIGPAESFRTYHQYVDALSEPTERQRIERAYGREHYEPEPEPPSDPRKPGKGQRGLPGFFGMQYEGRYK